MSVRTLRNDFIKVLSASKGYLLVLDSMDNKIERIGGTVSWRCNNPGNLKYGKFSKNFDAIGKDHIGHAVFPTLNHGKDAQYNLLFSQNSRYYNMSLIDAINRYAPSYDSNNPDKYCNYLCKKANVDRDDILGNLSEKQKEYIIEYMTIYEGYKEGKEKII